MSVELVEAECQSELVEVKCQSEFVEVRCQSELVEDAEFLQTHLRQAQADSKII